MATFWVARHGETTWNLAGRYQGRMESALTSLGMRQAFALADAFVARLTRGEAIPTRVISSPLLRCLATARVAAQRLGLEVEIDERLIEIAHGTWDGRYRDALAREDPERYRMWREEPARVSFENGEALADVLARWRSFARDASLASGDTLVVTHDAVVRCALVDGRELRLEQFWGTRVENAAFATFATTPDGLRLVDECDATHLAGLRANAAEQAL